MGRFLLQVPKNEDAQPEDKNLTETETVVLDLSAENERRFHATPDQLLIYTCWKLAGTTLSFDDWLSQQKWDEKAKKFIIPIV
jgi:hypothetical protein